ncbi:MAG TPA: CBS domain-containing protein [Sulfolobales archaeon]|nr:CBS domain-containing protein [Sulfolobales archaeon]
MYIVRKVGELIKKEPVTVSPSTSIRDAVKLMNEKNIGSVVITDPEGRVLGIFTERDLVRVIAGGISLDSNIGSVMTKNPVVVFEEDPVSKAVTVMAERRIRHLPVVTRNGILRGVITARDITETFKKYLDELGDVGD